MSEKVKLVISEAGVTQEEFASATGMSAERVSNVCRGRIKRLRKDEVDAIAIHYGINPQWLVNDQGKKALPKGEREALRRLAFLSDATDAAVALTDDPVKQAAIQQANFKAAIQTAARPTSAESLLEQFVFVPKFDLAASAGNGLLVHDESVVDHLAFKRDWIQRSLGLDPASLALIDARGDSMSPTINSGDLLLLDTRQGQVKSEGVYVINLNGALLVKRIRIKLSGIVDVVSDNPQYGCESVSGEELDRLLFVGRVVWHGRKF